MPDRQSPRTVVDKILCIQMEPDNHAIVRNISDGGLGFHAVYPITESGLIRFSFPQQNGHRIEASGELVWTDSTKKSGGLRFASLPGAPREQIRNWVAQAAAPARTGAASAAATAQPKEMLLPGVSPCQASVAATPHVPPPVMPLPQPAAPPYFALDEDSPHEGYTQDQEMSFPHTRMKFFLGFVTGCAIVSTVLVAAILFFADGYRVSGLLTTLRARLGASPASQAAPAVSPPEAVRPPLVSSDLPSADREAPATSAPDSEVAGDSKGNGAAGHAVTEPPFVNDHITRAPKSLPPGAEDTGDADLALAQSYLRGKTGPPGSAAAASFLWDAVAKGNVTAEITLADLYARGDGVTKSCEQARVLLRAAAGKSDSEASQNLSQIIRKDCP